MRFQLLLCMILLCACVSQQSVDVDITTSENESGLYVPEIEENITMDMTDILDDENPFPEII